MNSLSLLLQVVFCCCE